MAESDTSFTNPAAHYPSSTVMPLTTTDQYSTLNPSSSTNDGPIPHETLVAIKAELAREEAELDRLEELARRSIPSFEHEPILEQKDRKLDPNEPLVTDEQLWMCHELEVNGISGLNFALAEIAQSYDLALSENLDGKSTWRHVIERQQDTVLLNMLCTMEFEFLKAMIRGDLMHRYYTDDDFRLRVEKNHTLEKTPGNYLQMMCRKEFLPVVPANVASDAATQAGRQVLDEHRGKGFTFLELEELYRGIDDYAWKPEFAILVDGQYQGGDATITATQYRHDPSQPGYRRFFPNRNARKRIGEWQLQLEETYVKKIAAMKKANPDDPKLKIPMLRVFYEAGWGWDVANRATSHEDHRASNNLWTFYLALCEQLFPRRFEVMRFLINRLPRWSVLEEVFQDANISDVAMSIIASSFWFNCGLNPSPAAGGGVSSRFIDEYATWIKKNMKLIYETDPPSLFMTNINKYSAMQKEVRRVMDGHNRRHQLAYELRQEKEVLLEKVLEKRKHLERFKSAVACREIMQECDLWQNWLSGEVPWPEAPRPLVTRPMMRSVRQATPMPTRSRLRTMTPMPMNIVTPRRPRFRSSSFEIPLMQSRHLPSVVKEEQEDEEMIRLDMQHEAQVERQDEGVDEDLDSDEEGTGFHPVYLPRPMTDEEQQQDEGIDWSYYGAGNGLSIKEEDVGVSSGEDDYGSDP